MTLRQARKIRAAWVNMTSVGAWNRQSTVDRAMLRLGGFVVGGCVYDELRLLDLRGQRCPPPDLEADPTTKEG